jgi:hypothetical protein
LGAKTLLPPRWTVKRKETKNFRRKLKRRIEREWKQGVKVVAELGFGLAENKERKFWPPL